VASDPQPGESTLPIFERLFLGGEYSVRGYDIRSIGPRDIGTPDAPGTGIVIGGDKSLLFNAEYLITIAGPVRLVLFYDAGQVRDFGQNYALNQFKTSTGAEIRFFMPVLNVPFRLIFAHNPQRTDVFENDLTPAKKFTFKFAVGSTF
jgi:outer membrane protein insertion porin family